MIVFDGMFKLENIGILIMSEQFIHLTYAILISFMLILRVTKEKLIVEHTSLMYLCYANNPLHLVNANYQTLHNNRTK